jgi:hypothetical protein
VNARHLELALKRAEPAPITILLNNHTTFEELEVLRVYSIYVERMVVGMARRDWFGDGDLPTTMLSEWSFPKLQMLHIDTKHINNSHRASFSMSLHGLSGRTLHSAFRTGERIVYLSC